VWQFLNQQTSMNKAFSRRVLVSVVAVGILGLIASPLSTSRAASSGLPPAVAIRQSGTNFLVSWPTNASDGLSLASATQFPSATWTLVTPVMLQGTNYVTTAALAPAQQFFQLKFSSVNESNYDSADNWNFPNDNYWVCGQLKSPSAPTRYSDGSLVNGGAGYNVNTNASSTECGSGWVRFDLHEIISYFDGTKTNRLAFHKGGQGYTPTQTPYGHLSLDDISIFDGALNVSDASNVPHRGDPGAGQPQVQGQPPEYGAPSWDSSAKQWDSTKRNGRGATPLDPILYAIKIIPQGATNELPATWQYKPNVTSSRFNKYADAGPEMGDATAHFAYLTWSWLHKGDGVTTSGGGGMVRSLLRDGQEFYRCPVKAINSVAYGYNSSQIIGRVTAIYVKTRASSTGPWLYGWMISSHAAKLPDGTFAPQVDHIRIVSP
jgi:hypothetical protein